MGKRSCLVVLTLLSLVLSGCGRDQDKIVVNYCKALEAGRLDEAASYLSKDAKQALERDGGKSLLAGSGALFVLHKGIKNIKITKSKAVRENANVEFIYNFNDGSKYADFFPLVKEDGKWKISK